MKKNTIFATFCLLGALWCSAAVEAPDSQVLYWQVTPGAVQSYSASYLNLYAVINGDRVVLGYDGVYPIYAEESVEVVPNQTDIAPWWNKGAIDLSQASFYVELLNDNFDVLATSSEALYSVLAITEGDTIYMSQQWPNRGEVSRSNSIYTFAIAVPEPTSGLLMLFGLAGLALRRRRA